MSPPITQNMEEFDQLLDIYEKLKPERVLEIGTHHGGTLWYWLKYAGENAVVGSIDIQGIVTHENASEWARPDVTTLLFTGDSTTDEAITWATDNLGKLDFLFIDGGHDFATVESDFRNYSPLVREGGVVAFHDICPHEPYEGQLIEVDKFWELIKNSHTTKEFIEWNEEWNETGPGIGVLFV